MRKSIYRKGSFDVARSIALPTLFTLAVVFIIVSGLEQTEAASRVEGLRLLEDSLRRAVVVAYAIEGRYPESVAYIEENFGVYIDWTRYHVHYRIFASNLMPDIVVVEL